MNVALLFDSAGNLYQTRTADSKISLTAGDELADPRSPAPGGIAPAVPSRRIAPADSHDEGPERVAFPEQNAAARQGTR
jgi:hypothetical protein